MDRKEVAPGIFEYGNVAWPQDEASLKLVAISPGFEGNHFMVISIKLFYTMAKQCEAYKAMLAKIAEAEKAGKDSGHSETPPQGQTDSQAG